MNPAMKSEASFPRVGGWALAISIGFGPIYWFPGVPEVTVVAVKAVALTLFAVSFLASNSFKFPARYMGALALLVCAAAMSSIYHEDLFVLDAMTLAAIVIFAGAVSLSDSRMAMWKYVERGVLIFATFAALVIVDGVRGGGVPNPFYEYYYPLSLSGFAGGRTGWGVSCGFMMAFALIAAINRTTRAGIVWMAVAAVLAVNSFMVGTRGGTLTAALLLFSFVAISFKNGKRPLAIASVFILFFSALAFVAVNIEWIESTRVWQAFTGGTVRQENIRLNGYQMAFSGLIERPLAGFGEFDLEAALGYSEIHNLWLRLLVERGILAGGVTCAVVFWLVARLFKSPVRGASLVIIAGLLPTMFEPTTIFGNFFSTFGFWFVCIHLDCLLADRVVKPLRATAPIRRTAYVPRYPPNHADRAN